MQPRIIFMPHANIQYSQLPPEKRKWVIENCYGKLFDLIEEGDYKIAFEASGITIEEIAKKSPQVLEKLKKLVKEGKVEPVSSPYIHFMPANIPKEVCLYSLKHALDIWEKYVGVRPKVGWNPECGWASYIPAVYKEAGFEALVMDADSLLLSFDEIRKATGLAFDVRGHSNKNHLFKIETYIKDKPEFLQYITNPSVDGNGLKMIFRSDCMANLLLWYLMGATEGMRKEPVGKAEIKKMLENWKERILETGSFIMPYAEDAEYIGSTAYFYVKQFNEARFFEEEPDSVGRFREILEMAREAGFSFATPGEVLESGRLLENPYAERIESGVAWHGGTAKAWANTEFSRIMDPVCLSILEGIKTVAEKLGETWDGLDEDLACAMSDLECAWVSDSRWPPEPTSPGRFNVRESLDSMYAANRAIEKAMKRHGIEGLKSLYSPSLMDTQIRVIDQKLMAMKYFGEK